MFSRLRDRRRIVSAGLALLVQLAFLALLVQSLPRLLRSHDTAKELTLILPALPAPKVTVLPVPLALPRLTVPATPFYVFPTTPAPGSTAPHFSLQNLGIALFDCSPENWSNLTPEKRAHCTMAPGAGVAIGQAPDLLAPAPPVKDQDYWAAQLARRNAPFMLPGGINFPLFLLGSILSGSLSDPDSTIRNPARWTGYDQAPEQHISGSESLMESVRRAPPCAPINNAPCLAGAISGPDLKPF